MSIYSSDIFRLYLCAIVFGVISPKRRTTSVRIPVAIPTAALPKAFVTKVVVRDDADILTMLLPIRIVLISLLEFSVTFRTLDALLLPLSARDLRENLLTVVRAVSAEEKNADSATSTTKMIMFIMEPAPKISSPII